MDYFYYLVVIINGEKRWYRMSEEVLHQTSNQLDNSCDTFILIRYLPGGSNQYTHTNLKIRDISEYRKIYSEKVYDIDGTDLELDEESIRRKRRIEKIERERREEEEYEERKREEEEERKKKVEADKKKKEEEERKRKEEEEAAKAQKLIDDKRNAELLKSNAEKSAYYAEYYGKIEREKTERLAQKKLEEHRRKHGIPNTNTTTNNQSHIQDIVNALKLTNRLNINDILDKINATGMESLTEIEVAFLNSFKQDT